MGRQIENRPKSNYKNTKYGESPLLCRLGLHSASSVQRDKPFFKLDRESPLLPVLGGGVTVTSWFVRQVDVEGGYTHLHVSGASPSQQVVLVGSHRAARTLGFHILLRLPFGCLSIPSWAPGGVAPLSASSAVITVILVVSSTITSKRP